MAWTVRRADLSGGLHWMAASNQHGTLCHQDIETAQSVCKNDLQFGGK
jgi:hypothetical protein